jgi:MFS family permease
MVGTHLIQTVFVLLFGLVEFYAVASRVSLVLLFRTIQGILAGIVHAAGFGWIARNFLKYDGTALSLLVVWIGVGILLGPVCANLIYTPLVTGLPSYILAFICMCVAVLQLILLPIDKKTPLFRRIPFKDFKTITFSDRNALCFCNLLLSIGTITFLAFQLPSFFRFAASSLSEDQAYISFLTTAGIFVIGCPLAGYLTDRLGTKLPAFIGYVLSIGTMLLLISGMPSAAAAHVVFDQKTLEYLSRNSEPFIISGILCAGISMSLNIGTSLPQMLRSIRKFSKIPKDVIGGSIAAAIALGELAGYLISNIFGRDFGPDQFIGGCGLIGILYAVLVLWFLTSITINYVRLRFHLAGQIEAGDGLIDERMTEDRKLQLISGVRNRLLSSQVSEGPDSITTTAGGFDFKEETYDEEKLIKMENKCKAASQELRSTELSYVKNILVLIKKFYEPLAQLSRSRWRFALSENDLATLFNDITSIASLHQIIYDELKSSSESKVFTKHLDFFKLYTNYARSYEGILQILSKKKNDKKFRKILYGLQTSRVSLEGDFAIAPEDEPNFMNQTLESYLILPIQRIPRYILLFREIEKNMPRRTANLSELQLVDKIIRRLESVCHIINDFQTSHSNALDIVRIQDLIQDGHFYSLPDYLLQPHRKFLSKRMLPISLDFP